MNCSTATRPIYTRHKTRWFLQVKLNFFPKLKEGKWWHLWIINVYLNPVLHHVVYIIMIYTFAQVIDKSCRPHDHKLRKYLSLKLYSKYLEFYLTHRFDAFKIWTKCRFKHNDKILVDYHGYFKSYRSLKFGLVYCRGAYTSQVSNNAGGPVVCYSFSWLEFR